MGGEVHEVHVSGKWRWWRNGRDNISGRFPIVIRCRFRLVHHCHWFNWVEGNDPNRLGSATGTGVFVVHCGVFQVIRTPVLIQGIHGTDFPQASIAPMNQRPRDYFLTTSTN
jgi:hypothetical protein